MRCAKHEYALAYAYFEIEIIIKKKKKLKESCFLQSTTPENKLRLLMIYASVYPEKFEGDKASMLMQVRMI